MTNHKQKLEYFSSPIFQEIQVLFFEKSKALKIDNENSNVREIREFMFTFFESREFIDLYLNVAIQIVDHLRISRENSSLQMLPTPRVFRPNTIGTSYHCDYWYGHGEKSYTVWVPLSPIDDGNTFRVANDEDSQRYISKLEENKIFEAIPETLAARATPVLPGEGQAFVFSSKVLHGSPVNTSTYTRLSFDFRISSNNDPTSTKDLENYYQFVGDHYRLPTHEFDGARVLKYICGGIGKNTFIQHVIIEAAAKRFNMNVSEQEAEIERLGYPIFLEYVNEKMTKCDIKGIIIASKNILDATTINIAKAAGVKIWCALENDFLINL